VISVQKSKQEMRT